MGCKSEDSSKIIENDDDLFEYNPLEVNIWDYKANQTIEIKEEEEEIRDFITKCRASQGIEDYDLSEIIPDELEHLKVILHEMYYWILKTDLTYSLMTQIVEKKVPKVQVKIKQFYDEYIELNKAKEEMKAN